MNPGDVVFWPSFSYEDGGAQTNKLLVVIGMRGQEARLLLKTTSQASAARPDNEGCHVAASVFRFKANLAGFKVPTWVQFDPGICVSVQEMKDAGARVMFKLKPADLSAVINCYKKSDDISPEFRKFLPLL